MAPSSSRTPVMLYVPNLIGYFRIACMAASFYYACGCESSPVECEVERSNHRLAIVLYLLNFAGDVVDGYAARLFDQASKYGGVLDMVTDRVSTAGLCGLLAVLYPPEAFVFIMLIVLDIFSHWFHVVSAATAGKHHKENQGNFILKCYYGCYPIFAYCCLSQEFYYLARWILRFERDVPALQWATRYVFLPGCAMKQVVNVAQWWNAASGLAAADAAAAKKK